MHMVASITSFVFCTFFFQAPDLPALENRKAVLARAPQSILFQGIEIIPINLAMLGFVWDRRRKMRD